MNVPVGQVSALPGAAQRKLDALRETEQPPVSAPDPIAANTDAQSAPVANALPSADNVTTARVTLSRDDYNDLQAAAGKVPVLEASERQMKLRLEELEHRLTELQASGNERGNGPAPAAPAPASVANATLQLSDDVSITPEEEEQFGESRAYVEKVVDKRVAQILNPVLRQIQANIEDASNKVEGVTTQFRATRENTFRERVKAAVPDLAALVSHKNWDDFVQSLDEITGVQYEALLAHHIKNEKLEPLVAIYKRFRDKFVGPTGIATGYEGVSTGGEGGRNENLPNAGETPKLKWSDRDKASKDYRMGKITYAELQEVDKQFKEADKKGLVDYNA